MESSPSPSGDVTVVLRALADGDDRAASRLLPLVYDELRRLARKHMAGERAGHTLQATALVHEAYLRLTGGREGRWEDRIHFFRVAARAMRRVLIDRARHRASEKAGGAFARVDALDAVGIEPNLDQAVALSQALQQLESVNPRMAEVVELRYFAGLSTEETAQALNVTVRTVNRDWTAARAWLYRALGGREEAPAP